MLLYSTYHGRDCKVPSVHFLCEPVDLPTCVAENNGLGDGQSLVQVAQSVQLPVLPLDGDVELADT